MANSLAELASPTPQPQQPSAPATGMSEDALDIPIMEQLSEAQDAWNTLNDFYSSGMHGALKGQGYELPNWTRQAAGLFSGPDKIDVASGLSPVKQVLLSRLYKAGKSADDIRKELGMRPGELEAYIDRLDLDPPDEPIDESAFVNLPAYQEGGVAAAGQPALMGEVGPETVQGQSGTQVVGTAGPEVVTPQEDVAVTPHHEAMFTPGSPGLGAAPPNTGLAPLMDDPFERAAYRTQQSVQHGRGMPVEAAAPPIHTDEEMAEAAISMIGPAGLRAIMAVPKLATAALATYYGASGTEEVGAEEKRTPEQIKQLQNQLNQAGYLDAKDIDGKYGPKTEAAEARLKSHQAAEEAKQQRELESEKTKADAKTAEANAKLAEAKLEEARLNAAKLKQKEKGSERLKEVEKGVSTKQRILRDYATPVGVTAGVVGGAGARAAVSRISNKISGSRAASAASTMAEDAPNIASRVARVNEFWRKGGGKVPFTNTPGQAPGFAVNPKATDPSKLYQPSRVKNLATDTGVAGGFLGESVAAQQWMEEPARERLALATKAASEDPSEVNIQELQAAKDNLAIAEFWKTFGRVGAMSSVGTAKFMPRTPAIPSMKAAEAEKLSIEELLRNAEAAQAKAAKAAATRAAKKEGASKPREVAKPTSIPPAQFSPAAARARQKTPEESLQSIEQQLRASQ